MNHALCQRFWFVLSEPKCCNRSESSLYTFRAGQVPPCFCLGALMTTITLNQISELCVKCKRELKENSKLFKTVHPDTREHRTLLVPKYHLRALIAANRRWSEIWWIVPRPRCYLEPLAAVEVERREVLWTHSITDVSWCQQHDERSSCWRWEKDLASVRVIDSQASQNKVPRSIGR